MKNITWRRVAMILSVVIVGMLCFGVGYATGAMNTTEFLIEKVVQVMGYENINIDISRVELIQYYLKLKGGI